MRLLDQEIAGKIGRYYLAILGIAASLLLLENAPRVLAASSKLSQPMLASMLVMWGLVPEYLGIAGLFGIYATGAMLAYRLARRNELSGWSAAGISTVRLTAGLSVLALLNAAMILAMLGWFQPRGAIDIATVDRDVAIGRYGVAFESGTPTPIGRNGSLIYERIDSETGFLEGVFARLPDRTISSRHALVAFARGDAMRIEFRDGLVIDDAPKDRPNSGRSVVRFDRFNLVVANDQQAKDISELEPFQKLAELPDLIRMAGDPGQPGDTRAVAGAEAMYRLAIPLLSLLLAWLGFVMGLPDRTVSSLGAVTLGLCFIVLTLRFADLIRTLTPDFALAGNIVMLAVTAALCWAMNVLNHRLGNGFIDHALSRYLRKLWRRFGHKG